MITDKHNNAKKRRTERRINTHNKGRRLVKQNEHWLTDSD